MGGGYILDLKFCLVGKIFINKDEFWCGHLKKLPNPGRLSEDSIPANKSWDALTWRLWISVGEVLVADGRILPSATRTSPTEIQSRQVSASQLLLAGMLSSESLPGFGNFFKCPHQNSSLLINIFPTRQNFRSKIYPPPIFFLSFF